MIFGILFLIATLLIVIIRKDVTWQLNLTARTEILNLSLVSQTQWSIDPAVLCVRVNASSAPGGTTSICGDETLRALPPPSELSRRTLQLSPNADDSIEVDLATTAGGMVEMTLKSPNGNSLGTVNDDDATPQALPAHLIVKWPPSPRFTAPETLVLPFAGSATVGRDVAWYVRKSLHDGRLAVFAESDEVLAGRAKTEESILILGDQVELDGIRGKEGTLMLPKGFIRFNTAAAKDGVKLMDVVIFARAEGVRIQRYGGGEYSFKPGWWVKIKHQSTLAIAIVLLTGFLSLVSSMVNITQALAAMRLNRDKRPPG